MRKSRKHIEDETDVDMTPMLDIVFIMLIFFIVTTSFVKEKGVDIDRPTASKDKAKDTTQKGPIFINIDENDQITVDNRLIELSAVRANVENARTKNPTGMVIVRVAEGTSTGVSISAYDQARSSGADKVVMAKNKKE